MKSFALILAGAGLSSAALYANTSPNNHTCQLTNSNSILSCSSRAQPNVTDSCCVETYGGLLLFTQFWDTYTGLESQGQLLPEFTWTLHGLWPDFCNGSYTQYCDLNRQYDRFPSPNTTDGTPTGKPVPPYNGTSIANFITDFGRYDLLQYMNTYWVAQGQPSYQFWEHEFSKHATCFSTFDVPCYGPQYANHSDIIDFFQTAIMYYRRTPTWGWLSAANIRPSNATQYTLGSLQTALTRGYGALPYLGCTGPRYNETTAGKGTNDTGRTVLDEVWYYANAYGRPQSGVTVPLNATGSVTSCTTAPGAIWYYEPTASSVRKGVASGY